MNIFQVTHQICKSFLAWLFHPLIAGAFEHIITERGKEEVYNRFVLQTLSERNIRNEFPEKRKIWCHYGRATIHNDHFSQCSHK